MEATAHYRFWLGEWTDAYIEFDGPHGPHQARAAINPDHIGHELDRGWPVGERRQFTSTIWAKRIS